MWNQLDCDRHNDNLNLELTHRGSFGILLPQRSAPCCCLPRPRRPRPSVVRIEVDGCNAVAFSQIPGATDLFLGRRFNNANGDCLPGDPVVNRTSRTSPLLPHGLGEPRSLVPADHAAGTGADHERLAHRFHRL